jgi:hypothetical protein
MTEFYNCSNELSADELRLATIFREKAREDLAVDVVEGAERLKGFFFALVPESSFSRYPGTSISLHHSSGLSTLKMRSWRHIRVRL